jgi:formylglycine-generating enzyme required for sulfatase activity
MKRLWIEFVLICFSVGMLMNATGCQSSTQVDDDTESDTNPAVDTSNTGDTGDTSDTSDTTDTADTGDTSDTSDTTDTADTSDTSDTSDTADTSDTSDTSDTADTADTSDTSDTSDTADTADTADTSDTTDTESTDPFDTDIPMDTDNQAGLDWVFLEGGTFQMGDAPGLLESLPIHPVTVPSFEITRTEITTAQYRVCTEANVCSLPIDNHHNYFGLPGYDNHPVTHVTWQQARLFCLFATGRLPSESEWEFAARSRGLDILYPWGDDPPTNDNVIEWGPLGSGTYPMPVCSRPAGNTAQGLCDMSGNVKEYVQDTWHNTYDCSYPPGCDNGNTGAHPDDGSAWEYPSGGKVVRGDPIKETTTWCFTNRQRDGYDGGYTNTGFRCARTVP